MESLKGQLLLASPALFDPNFRRTVVLVAEHTDRCQLGKPGMHQRNLRRTPGQIDRRRLVGWTPLLGVGHHACGQSHRPVDVGADELVEFIPGQLQNLGISGRRNHDRRRTGFR